MIGFIVVVVRKPNHNTTTYCFYWRTTTTINPIIIRPHIVFTDGRQRQPNHNITTYCVYWRTTTQTQWLSLLSSVSKHTMWSYYDWVYCCCCPSVNIICGRIMNPIIIRPHCMFTDRRQQRQPNDNTTTYCVYWRTTTTINPIIIRPHCMFTDRRQQRQPNHNMTTCIMIGFIVVVVR
jgi:hypothetical protein